MKTKVFKKILSKSNQFNYYKKDYKKLKKRNRNLKDENYYLKQELGNIYKERIFKKIKDKKFSELTISIKSPNPIKDKHWGDYFFALSLQKALEKKGFKVIVDEHENWYINEEDIDIVIVLRGLKKYKPSYKHVNLMWNISHPDMVSKKEYDEYDIVFVASEKYANELSQEVNTIVEPLLQCTDEKIFYPEQKDDLKTDILFVGNTRGVYRKIIKDALDTKHDVTIYGPGWEKFIDKKYIKGEFIENKELNKYYSSCKILLNDHWEDMIENDFISNRLFDALACETFVISDEIHGAKELFNDSIITYNGIEDLNKKLDYYLNNPKEREKLSKKGKEIVLKNHTFNNRAAEITESLEKLVPNKNKIKISVILPIYNAQTYLKESLDSILNQSLKEIEVLCVDHESDDNSLNILKEIAKKDKRVKIFHCPHENRGAGAPRNIGLDNAKGEYIHFIDPDDWIVEGTYKKLYNKAKTGNLDLLLFRALSYMEPKGNTYKTPTLNFKCLNKFNENSIFNIDSIGSDVLEMNGASWNKLIKKELIDKSNARFPEGIFSQDHAFSQQLYITAKRIGIIKKYLYYYRKHEDSVTATTGKKQFDIITSRNKVIEVYKKFDAYNEFKVDIINQKIDILKGVYERMEENYFDEFVELLKEDFEKMELNKEILNEIKLKNKEFYLSIIKN